MLSDAFSKLFTDSSTNSQFSSSECCVLFHYLDAHQHHVFLSFLGTWEITFPSHFRPMDHKQKWHVQLPSGGNGTCFSNLQAHPSLAKLAWRPRVRIREPQGESSLIPRSLAGRDLPWRAAGRTAGVASSDIASHWHHGKPLLIHTWTLPQGRLLVNICLLQDFSVFQTYLESSLVMRHCWKQVFLTSAAVL